MGYWSSLRSRSLDIFLRVYEPRRKEEKTRISAILIEQARISENFDFIFVAFQQGVLFIFLALQFEHE